MILFSAKRRRERDAADRLYSACAAAARRPDLFTTYGVPDTLQGRFEMLTLHLFPVLRRLMHDPGEDPDLARLVAECFVSDMDAALREMGVGDVTVPKRMRTLYRSFGGRIGAYNKALESSQIELASAIERNVFPGANGEQVPVNLDKRAVGLARYIGAAITQFRNADLQLVRMGETPFPSIPPQMPLQNEP